MSWASHGLFSTTARGKKNNIFFFCETVGGGGGDFLLSLHSLCLCSFQTLK